MIEENKLNSQRLESIKNAASNILKELNCFKESESNKEYISTMKAYTVDIIEICKTVKKIK